ncbi:transcriptional regulator family: Fungal Specific TF [Penicillium roqueforti]|nr:transcriptional regulator family: Fungal Specific TF [Penicillium roqueforti]
MPPLRAHTKSRNGCDQCRNRRVKCDEQGPPCSNCTTRELKCTYLKVAAARRATAHLTPPSSTSDVPRPLDGHGSPTAVPGRAVPTAIPVPAPAQTNSFGIDNLELMHKFATETYESLCISDSEIKIWQITIPTLAFKHGYLMSGILALASMHIATTCEPPELALLYYETGLQYYNRSLTPFRNAIDNITPQNCDAVFAHSIVMIAISIASPRLTVTKDECASITENIVILFELLQGVKKIIQVTKSWIKLELFSQGEFWKNTPAELDTDAEAALTHLSELNDQVMIGIYSGQHLINKKVIAHLRHCYAKFARSADPAPVLAWLAAVEKEFVDSLRCRQPFSLLILMYWGVLLRELDGQRWWARDSGRALVSELFDALRCVDARWERAFAWVQRKMEL